MKKFLFIALLSISGCTVAVQANPAETLKEIHKSTLSCQKYSPYLKNFFTEVLFTQEVLTLIQNTLLTHKSFLKFGVISIKTFFLNPLSNPVISALELKWGLNKKKLASLFELFINSELETRQDALLTEEETCKFSIDLLQQFIYDTYERLELIQRSHELKKQLPIICEILLIEKRKFTLSFDQQKQLNQELHEIELPLSKDEITYLKTHLTDLIIY